MNEQGTEAWLRERAGKVTASKVADVVAKTRTGWGASRANYMAQLIAERLTGQPAESFMNDAMRWGTEQEPHARAAYEAETGNLVTQVGFIPHPKIQNSGASPDGETDEIGLIEIKCPGTATHIDTLLGEPIAQKYVLQMQWQMACTGRQWCDFVSFDPRMPAHMRLHIQRVERDDKLIASLEKDVTEFLRELDNKLASLNQTYALEKAA